MGKRLNGEGSIYQREDGRWSGYIYIETEKGNKRRYVYGETAKEVSGKIKEIKKQIEERYAYKSEKMNLAQWMEIYLIEYKKNVLKPSTYDSYMINYKAHILRDSIGKHELRKLSTTDLQLFYNRKYEKLSSRTVKYISVIIRSVLEQALKEGYITKNPNKAIVLPKQKKQEIKPFAPEEINRLLETARKDDIEKIITFAVHTGMREGEILGLKWEDVYFEKQEITVRNNLCRIVDETKSTKDTTYYKYTLSHRH